MKRFITLFGLLFLSFTVVSAQDVFDHKEPVTWLGLDFSSLKLIKTDEVITNGELQTKYFPGWNDLILNEPKKYDIAKATGRSSVENYIDAVTAINEKAKADFITTDINAFQHLDNAKVTQMVKKYNLKGKSGIGLVFIVEAMDKTRKEASVWVTFIDMSTKEVLLSQPVTGESGGFGFRNYWAASFNKILKAMPVDMRIWKKGK
jgi:hypothetical protein